MASKYLSDETKSKAQEKLDGIIIKIGYPDNWRNISKLNIDGDSYWADMVLIKKIEFDHELNKLNKPVDKLEWGMPP